MQTGGHFLESQMSWRETINKLQQTARLCSDSVLCVEQAVVALDDRPHFYINICHTRRKLVLAPNMEKCTKIKISEENRILIIPGQIHLHLPLMSVAAPTLW